MLVPNKHIWMQIQINKHLLPTNYSVSQYDGRTSPACSFCSAHFEKLHFLFWRCGVVEEFWCMISNLIVNFFPDFKLGHKEAIFGESKSLGSSPTNTILVIARYYIWRQKFLGKTLDEVDFILYAQSQLQTIYECQKYKPEGERALFVVAWDKIMDHFHINN